MSEKVRTAIISIAVPAILAAIKTIVGIFTLSISILASALDSLMDLCSSAITVTAVLTAGKPADKDHPFGHGKAEAIAGLIQAIFITGSAGMLIYHAFRRIGIGYHLADEAFGIGTMIVSIAASACLSRHMRRVGQRTESVAINAGALNFSADVWTNMGVIVALGLERWGAVRNADPIISILISLYIIASSVRIGRDSVTQLMDKTLPEEMLATINGCICAYKPHAMGHHKLRTRLVGSEKYIEFHLEIDSSLSFKKAHDITESIIADIEKAIPGSRVTVHSDPS